MKPYKDTFLNRNTRIRSFKQNVSSEELVWHRDRSDRVVKIVEGIGWQLQMDNGLPEKLVAGKEYHIPANNYHRLIKGKTDLVAEIKEDKMKITRQNINENYNITSGWVSEFAKSLEKNADFLSNVKGVFKKRNAPPFSPAQNFVQIILTT